MASLEKVQSNVTANRQPFLWICLFLVAITWAVFGQTLGHDFVNFDDRTYVYGNPVITRGVTLSGIVWAFTHGHALNWHPLTTISHMVDCQLFGLKAGGHHFTNVLLHTTAVLLLFVLLREMTGNLWRSAFVAAVFAIHPLRVESVAWVAERKDVLSAVFFMLTLGAYVRYTRKRTLGRYMATLVLFAVGLAAKGFKPFCAIYSTFLQRAFDPIVHDVCLQNLPVVFCMDRGGLSADDGPTHHGVFDISYLRAIPNLVHMVPKDEDELADMLFTAMQWNGPIAVRYPRGLGPGTPVKDVPRAVAVGKAELLQHSDNDRVAIFALGALVPMAEEIARKLEGEGIAAAVINARFVKPMDVEMLEFFAGTVEVILTLEDHVLRGGFGSAVLEELNILGLTTPVVRIGWPDHFIEHGKQDALRTKYGITPEAALVKLRPYLRVRQPQPV